MYSSIIYNGDMEKELKIRTYEFKHLLNPNFEAGEIDVTVHTHNSNTIVIIYPGANGTKDGYENKYRKMAQKLVENRVGAVIRSSNKYIIGNGWTTGLEVVIEYALKASVEICGTKNPDIYLIGHSVGAGAVSLVACAYDNVKKVLLTSPAPISKNNKPEHRINEFEGEVHVRIPENDRSIPREQAMEFYDLATNASQKTVEIIPSCDHEWSGESNLDLFIKQPVTVLKNKF
jgi:hypothetical protein